MRIIREQFRTALQFLEARPRIFLEATFANYFRMFVLGQLVPASSPRSLGDQENAQISITSTTEAGAGTGRLDWTLTIPGHEVGRVETTSVMFEFKRVDREDTRTRRHAVVKAQLALEQIVGKRYSTVVPTNYRRIDVGVAAGNVSVVVRQRFWRRATADELQNPTRHEPYVPESAPRETASPEEINTFDRGLIALDDSGWVDDRGWITTPVNEEFRAEDEQLP
ncbi:hypothetical protein EV175_002716 [Coemansia sp. RSA 1933]|nr:hypothetical protein EV175_002716 [Coemansia sp. RSA 1933]